MPAEQIKERGWTNYLMTGYAKVVDVTTLLGEVHAANVGEVRG